MNNKMEKKSPYPKCAVSWCTKNAYYNVIGAKRGKYCRGHKQDNMHNVHAYYCQHIGCTTMASFGYPEIRECQFCFRHMKNGMINIRYTSCAEIGCYAKAKFNWNVQLCGKYCLQHKKSGMIDVSKKPNMSDVSNPIPHCDNKITQPLKIIQLLPTNKPKPIIHIPKIEKKFIQLPPITYKRLLPPIDPLISRFNMAEQFNRPYQLTPPFKKQC